MPAKSPTITRDDQLGSLKAIAEYMCVSRTWLSGVKRRYNQLPAGHDVPVLFASGKTCAMWVREFIRHPINRGFVATRSYKTKPQ
jgi:hypothetical protein